MPMPREKRRPETDDEYRIRVQRMHDREQYEGRQLVNEKPPRATIVESTWPSEVYVHVDLNDPKEG